MFFAANTKGEMKLEQHNSNKNKIIWQQIREEERYKIKGLLETKITQKNIAETIEMKNFRPMRYFYFNQIICSIFIFYV
jgi:hypothetical protein